MQNKIEYRTWLVSKSLPIKKAYSINCLFSENRIKGNTYLREGEKAKAILWVDYKRGRKITDGTPIRTVKVYADVHADGSLKVLSWCKKQPMKVENYLLKRVEVYRIRKEIFEGGYLKPGEQYLQLRYLPGEVK